MRRVLLGFKSDWQPLLDQPDLLPGYRLAMQPLEQAELAQFDVIVPRSLADQALLRHQRDRGRRPPCLLPPAPAEQICDDKLMLNRMLQMAGFAALVPTLLDRFPETAAQFPVVMKQRRDDWGQNCHVIRSPEEARAFRLDPARSFLQAHVPGEVEYATHMMLHRGRLIYDATIRYIMPSTFAVKGRRAEPLQRDWLAVTPERDLLCRILRCIGFSEGLCCLDYRIHDGQLYLFEINPRPGGSLGERLADFLPRYAGAVMGERV